MNESNELRSLLGEFPPLAAPVGVRAELGARLDALIAGAPPEQRKPGRRRALRRTPVSVVALAGVLLVGAAWTASDFHFAPFSGDPAPLTTASVRSWLEANYAKPPASIVPATVSAVGMFSTPRGETTVYTGRSADGTSYVAAYVRGGQVVTAIGMSVDDLRAVGGASQIALSANYLSPGDFGRVWQIWGTVSAGVAAVELKLGDGTTTPVPLHDGVFLILRPADCDPATALIALDGSGHVIGRTTDLQIGSGC